MSNPQLPEGYSFYVTDGDVMVDSTLTGKPVPYSTYVGAPRIGSGYAYLHVIVPSKNPFARLFGAWTTVSSSEVLDTEWCQVRTHNLTDEILRLNMEKAAKRIAKRVEWEITKERFIGKYPPKDVDRLG